MSEDKLAELGLRLEELKQQVDSLRKQQEELTAGVQELLQTFKSLAMHLGVATEPYRPGKKKDAPSTGFA